MKKAQKVWVLIFRKKIETDIDSVKIFGNLKKLCEEEIFIFSSDGEKKRVSEGMMRSRVSSSGYWRTDDYIIIEREVKKSTFKIKK